MNWEGFYLVCFGVGLVLSVASFAGGFGHLHLGHFGGHLHAGHGGHGVAVRGAHGAQTSGQHGSSRVGHWLSALNGFTVTAFLCWFGGAGYLLGKYTDWFAPVVLLGAIGCGLLGGAMVWGLLFKVLLPHEHTLSVEETEMGGVVARVSNQIREGGGIGEIIFSQGGGRRAAAARSDDGTAIDRGTEVVVLRYERGVAYVRRWEELAETAG